MSTRDDNQSPFDWTPPIEPEATTASASGVADRAEQAAILGTENQCRDELLEIAGNLRAPAPSREAAPLDEKQAEMWARRIAAEEALTVGLTPIEAVKRAALAQPSAERATGERLTKAQQDSLTLAAATFEALGIAGADNLRAIIASQSADLAAGGELPPLPEPDAKFYELDDFGNTVGRDTDDYTEKRMREYGAACAAAARRAAISNAGVACTYPNCACIGGGVFKPCVKQASAPVGEAVRDGLAEKLLNAAIACGHIITDEKITLHRNPKLSGNALDQLGNRLKNRLPRAAAPSHPDEPAGEGSAK